MAAITEDEITTTTAYTVRFAYGHLSPKRFRDAVALVKGIDGRRDSHYYDPSSPDAKRTGYVANTDAETSTAKYDGASRTWTVTIAAHGDGALADLRIAVSSYDAIVERA